MSELTQKKFKEIASQLHLFTQNNKEPSLSQVQQALAQAMYSKPYEEVKETILSGKNIVNVYLCNNKYYLFNKSRFVKKINKCDDKKLKIELKSSRIKNDGFTIVEIPTFTEEEFFNSQDDYKIENNEIIPNLSHVVYMVEKMGYFKPVSIFDEFENCDHFFISEFDKKGEHIHSNVYSEEAPCGDWFANVEMEGIDALVMIIEEPNICEYLTFEDLSKATFNGEIWSIVDKDNSGISLKFKSSK